jgi:uncharacterized protein (DUF2141 family)
MKKIVLIIASICAVISAKSQTVSLTVVVSNVTTNDGMVKVCVFNKADAFPEATNLAVKCITVKATKGVMQIKIDGIAAGKYAIAAHHDKNNDGKFNTNFFGIPSEMSGASNGAKGKMGAPKYKDAEVALLNNQNVVSIKIE